MLIKFESNYATQLPQMSHGLSFRSEQIPENPSKLQILYVWPSVLLRLCLSPLTFTYTCFPAFPMFAPVCVQSLSCVRLFVTSWSPQAPLSVDFSRQEYGVGCYFLLQGIFPTQRLNLCLWHLLHWAHRFITVPPGNCNILNISVSGHVLAACSLEKTYSQDTDITFFSWKSTGLTLSFHSNITLWQTFCGSPINIVTFHSLQALGH